MRAMRLGLMVFAVVVGMATAVVARAQDAGVPCTPGVMSMVGIGIVAGASRNEVRPFTAKIKGTYEQRLPDGNYIRGEVHTIAARDSTGRTRNETSMQCHRDENGKPMLEKMVAINDPKAHTALHWQEGGIFGIGMEKKATLIHVNLPSALPALPKLLPEELAARRKIAAAQQPRSEFKHEDLGTRNIAGVEAHGNRTTITFPPGEQGNELRLVVVDENWRSEELGMTMMVIHDDPRSGRSVQEVEEVDKEEPVAALFAPPEGYKIVEMKPQVEVPVTTPAQ